LKNILLLALGLLGAGFLWAVAPALSTQPYVPAGHDFTQPVPEVRQVADVSPALAREIEGEDHGYGLEGPVVYRTAPLTAPHRFDFVGVEGEMGALEFRARESGAPWSDWVEAAHGDPVYTGGTEEVQIRSRGTEIEGELHYVNVSGDKTAAEDLLTSMRSTVNDAVISAFDPAEAQAAIGKPDFVSRSEWGANRKNGGCHPRKDPDYGKVKAGVIHHTVSTNDYSEAQAPSVVLGICRYHRNSNGWNDIGYNALVDRFGNLYEGRGGGLARPVVGAHVEGFNSQTAGIAAIADHRGKKPTRTEKRAIVEYLAWKLGKAGIDAEGSTRMRSDGGSSNRYPAGKRVKVKEVLSHSDLGFTECAGTKLREQVPAIRRKIQDRIAASGGGDGGGGGDDPSGGSSPRG
jgi:hypothetical protein